MHKIRFFGYIVYIYIYIYTIEYSSVAAECLPAWNTDGIVTDGEVENCPGKQLSVSLCRPQEVYIAFTATRFYLWISGEVSKTA